MDNKICDLPENYVPSDTEEFMNDFQREYFRLKLEKWKESLLLANEEGLQNLKKNNENVADVIDWASTEVGVTYEIRTKERIKKLIEKIDQALAKIQNKTYGFCEETGEPIDLKRLEARPVASLGIEAQARHEAEEKTRRG